MAWTPQPKNVLKSAQMCSNKILVPLESSIQALSNDGSLILQSGALEALEAFEVPPITENSFKAE